MAHEEIEKLAKFAIIGLINTTIGYFLFLAFFFLAYFSAPLSNTLSYLIVIIAAFYLYRRFVFDTSHPQTLSEVLTYVGCAGLSFGLNLLVLIGLASLGLYAPVAQIGAMVTYTIVFYLLNRLVVFRVKT